MLKWLAAVLVLANLLGVESAFAKRVALVIGNAKYTHVGVLANPPRDVISIVEALKQAGFDDVQTASDLDLSAMNRELQNFSARAAGAEVALIYYAGHGVEVNGSNFLIPTQAKLEKSTDVYFEAVPLDLVRTTVAGASKLKIIILDACRNNPFKLASANGKRSASRGLRGVETASSELIVYAAKEGTVAQDGANGSNSPFATALASAIKQPGLEVRLLFGRVRDDVLAATNKEQEPFTYTSLGGDAVYLNPVLTVPDIAVVLPEPAPTAPVGVGIDVAWQSVKQSGNKQALEAFAAFYAKDPLFGLYGSLVNQALFELQVPKKNLAALEPLKVPPSPTEIPTPNDGFDPILVSAIQSELKRVACYNGKSDGKWGPEALSATAKFNKLAATKLTTTNPSTELLVALQEKSKGFCAPVVVRDKTKKTTPRVKQIKSTREVIAKKVIQKAVPKPERVRAIAPTKIIAKTPKIAAKTKQPVMKRGRNSLDLCPGQDPTGSGNNLC